MSFSTACVLGLGYVGLPTAATLAARGLDVVGVDIDPKVCATINGGDVHFVEPGLDMLVRSAVESKRLRAVAEPEPADAFLIAVPTPFKNGFKPNLDAVMAAARSIAPVVKRGDLVVVESTCPVGTTDRVCELLAALRPDLGFPHQSGDGADIQVAHCPERVLPGRVILEVVENDRTVGGVSPRCTERAIELYRIFCNGNCLPTDSRTAELVKLVENSYRDLNIAFANELSHVCDRLGLDVWEVIDLANKHPRVNILRPGPGVGGHCLAVDPWFIVDSAPDDANLIRLARATNARKPQRVAEAILDLAAGRPSPRIACLGLSYKSDIDDLRHSPSVEIVERISAADGVQVSVVEPFVKALPESLHCPNVSLETLDKAIDDADIVAILVRHSAFAVLRPDRLAGKLVVDAVGLLHGRNR